MCWNKLNVKAETMRKPQLFGYILAAFCLISLGSNAQFTETKQIHKSFAVLPETQIDISHKYGKIDINTWDKDSVIIDIDIRVEEKKLSKLEESLRGIDFNITNNEHYLTFHTEVEKKGMLSQEFQKFKESVLSSESNIEIDLAIWLPKTNELRVENKFGDIYIDDFDGEINISLSNGNLKAHNFSNKLDLKLSFADATVNKIEEGRLNCNFSDVYIKHANSVKINSKSTEFEFQNIVDLNAISRRDKFRIRKVEIIDAESSFSHFRIDELTDRLYIRSNYGDIEVEDANREFSKMNIESRSTDVELYFTEDSQFNFEILHSKAEIDFGPDVEVIKEEEVKEKQTKISGAYANKSEDEIKLDIKATGGDITIR